MKYKIAIFDLDGTILNTLDDLADTMNYCLTAYNMPLRSISEIRNFVGNGIHRLVELAVPEGTDSETIDKIFIDFNNYYKDHCAIKTCPYAGILDVLSQIKKTGMLMAVVSNKADYAVSSLCDDYFTGLFDYSVGEKEGQRRKPYPDSVNAVLAHFGLTRDDAVYIGDSDVDLKTAQNAGTDVIMVGWGFRDKSLLFELGADCVLDTPDEILKCL